MLNVTVRGLTKLKRDLKVEGKRANKAMVTATRVEAFRLAKVMRQEIRKSAPGGDRFAPLSYLARRGYKRLKPDKPLAALARAVRYQVRDRDPLDIRVGFTGLRTSATWKRIARKQQEGFTETMPEMKREMFADIGGRLGKRSKVRKYMFLERSTRTFTTPARPILEPFWEAHRSEAMLKIRDNFRRKMRGQRI